MVCGVNVTPLILLIAIGFHSIFEGIALGMTNSESIFINLMIGVTLHHIAATISLGVSLGQHKVNSKKAIFGIFFGLSLIEPAGIGIGIGISSAPELVSSIVMSLAGGTFIYIACSEILVHEFGDNKNRYLKFFFFMLGSAAITVLWFLDKHEDKGHSDEVVADVPTN
jgi:solute carrier family 39 (zinc transporter), member 1/2/3